MKEYFCFVVVYWYSFCNIGVDFFGLGIMYFFWDEVVDLLLWVKDKMDVVFEFIIKMNILFFCFYDVDFIDEGDSLVEFEKCLDVIIDYVKEKMEVLGVGLLWGIVNLFFYFCYMNGVVMNFDFVVVVYVGVQVKFVFDVMIKLGGENYVFWGGWEGYFFLFNMDMKCEFDYLVIFLYVAKDYVCK